MEKRRIYDKKASIIFTFLDINNFLLIDVNIVILDKMKKIN